MPRRSATTHKGVEEKRRSLPIYQHYTLSPGRTKSHHPEAKCNHCLKEFVCGSKQRLIRHLRKCNSITNPEQIIAETLNTLARNSATGTLNHSILEASNLLPSQVSHLQHRPINITPQQIQTNSSTTLTTANSNNNNSIVTNNGISSSNNNNTNHNTSGSSTNDSGLIAGSSNGSQVTLTSGLQVTPIKRATKRGRRPNNPTLATARSGIHVTTDSEGKTHFTPASQLPPNISGTISTPLVPQVHNGRQVGYAAYNPATVAAPMAATPGAHLSSNSGHLTCATSTQLHPAPQKLNTEVIDKAYLKLVLTRNLPLSLCDTKEFQLWVKTLANDYKPPSSINLIAQNLKIEAQAAKQRISNILVKTPKKTINLELHCWPEESHGHLWYAVVATMDYKRFLVAAKDMARQDRNGSNNNQQPSNQSVSNQQLTEFIDDCIDRVGSDRTNSLVFSGANETDSMVTGAYNSLSNTNPSVITYYCWWRFTNLLCSDIVESNHLFQNVIKDSNRLINFITKRPKIALKVEKFSPFAGITRTVYQKKSDRRWYSHLVCYLLEYMKNNREAITRALEAYSTTTATQSHLSSDTNNNSSGAGNNLLSGDQQQIRDPHIQESTQQEQMILTHDDYLNEIKSMVMSSNYWTSLDLALVYLRPIHNIVALTSTISTQQQQNNSINNNNSSILSNEQDVPVQPNPTPSVSATVATTLTLSDYMHWFINYGRALLDDWTRGQDVYKHRLIGLYFKRFSSCLNDFKLLIAAYLLNPRHRCAFMTQKAKNTAIEEVLNIASHFMSEVSDGHTIFDQWKLYLIREEPYDVVYDENRSTPLDWWMSLPCAESIRRVALRILRLKAFVAPRSETLFSQLYFYEDESKQTLNDASFEDLAILRHFYDYEDKIGQPNGYNSSYNSPLANHLTPSSNCLNQDRTQIGHLHNNNQSNFIRLPSSVVLGQNSNGPATIEDALTIEDVVVDSYINNHNNLEHLTSLSSDTKLTIDSLPGYDLFLEYVDFNERGVQIIEEPIEKKKRKWTAQEILSKCQSNHPTTRSSTNNNNNNIDIGTK